jgi:hypothetical protein
MELFYLTLAAWVAFAAAAILPGVFLGQVARGCGIARA